MPRLGPNHNYQFRLVINTLTLSGKYDLVPWSTDRSGKLVKYHRLTRDCTARLSGVICIIQTDADNFFWIGDWSGKFH